MFEALITQDLSVIYRYDIFKPCWGNIKFYPFWWGYYPDHQILAENKK